ncbi:MAG: carboxypeptidase regulatory-like domain-containing protein [Bacteroidales bacterium]
MIQLLKKGLLIFTAFLCGSVAFAQVTTSSLAGRITEESGEPLAGANVVAVHTPSGTQYATVANAEGRYVINGMRVGGPYKVTISFLGFQTQEFTDVTLELGETFSLNTKVKEDAQMLTSAVVMASPSSKFAVEKTGAATNISKSQIESVPTISRSITDVAKLSPYGGNGMSFAGSDGRTANFTVDGANFNNNFGLSSNLPGGGNPISIDAIEEVQVVISPFDVRQTNFIGGGVNAITKSGTNTFKGSAYVYHNNENMRGDAVDGTQISGARDKDRTTTYGFTLGGPIIKNKLFFFVNYEESKIPTVVNRWQASEDGVANADAYISRTKISDMKKVSEFLKSKYGYDTGSYTDFPADESNRKILARLDWNINDNNHLALRYNYTLNKSWNAANASSSDAKTRTTEARFSQYSMSYANSMYSMNNTVNSFSLDFNSRINDKLSNQLLVTYSKLDDTRGSNSSEFPFIDILDGTGTISPYISVGYELFTWNNGVHNTVINAKDDLTYYLGAHKITGGLSYEYQMADNSYMRNGTGYYRYNSLDDFLSGATPETVCFTYGYDNTDPDNPAARVRFHKAGLYVQDEWNVNDKLKLTGGIRFDGLFFDNQDLMTNQAVYDLDYNGKHIDTGKWPDANLTVSPRIGFNWDVFGNNSLKVRGGSGLFSGRLPLVFFTNMPTNSGMIQYNGKIQVGNDKLASFAGDLCTSREEMRAKWASLGYPTSISPEDGTVGSTFAAVDPDFKMPQVWKTSVAVDYAFPTPFPMSVTAEGIFNKTINAVRISDWSILPVDGFARFNGADDRPIYPDTYKYTYTNSNGKVVGMPNAFVLTNTNKGYGGSASLSLNMQPVKGINFTAAYTHTVSKELTGMPGSDASSAFTYIPTYEGPNNTKLHNSQYVTPDRFFASLTINDKCNNHYSLFYEAWRGGANYSYMYTNDMNGDSYKYDALYIPKNKDEIRFVSQDDADRFWNYLENDDYLSSHKGEYAEAYSVYSPWAHKIDFSYAHDFKIKIGKSTNTLQLNFNVQNLLNIFNSSWGVTKYMNPTLNSGRILTYEGVDAEGYPTFSTPSAVKPGVDTWTFSHTLGQCWYAQIGIKYFFN